MKSTYLVSALSTVALIAACSAVQQNAVTPTPGVPVAETVESFSAWPADTPHTLVVVARDADAPDRSLRQASISVVSGRGDPRSSPLARHAATDQQGVAMFERVASGGHTVDVRRIGYAPFRFVVVLRDKCRREVLEVYVGEQANCLFECPPTPGRAILTTCRRLPNER